MWPKRLIRNVKIKPNFKKNLNEGLHVAKKFLNHSLGWLEYIYLNFNFFNKCCFVLKSVRETMGPSQALTLNLCEIKRYE